MNAHRTVHNINRNNTNAKVQTLKLSVTLSNLNRFSFFSHCGKCTKFATKPIRQWPLHHRDVATLPWEITNLSNLPAVGCHYFPPGLWSLLSQRTSPSFDQYQVILLGDRGRLIWTTSQGCYAALSWSELNPRPTDPKSNVLRLCHLATCHDPNISIVISWQLEHCCRRQTDRQTDRRQCNNNAKQ